MPSAEYGGISIGYNPITLAELLEGISKNRSERLNVGSRSGAVRLYGEHLRPEIGLRSRFLEMPLSWLQQKSLQKLSGLGILIQFHFTALLPAYFYGSIIECVPIKIGCYGEHFHHFIQ